MYVLLNTGLHKNIKSQTAQLKYTLITIITIISNKTSTSTPTFIVIGNKFSW